MGQLGSIYNQSLVLRGETDNTTNIVARGLWLGHSGAAVEHTLEVRDYEETDALQSTLQGWVDRVTADTDLPPELVATKTLIELHEPYGVLETRVEVLKVGDISHEFDWYDVTVNQELTPGSNSSGSDWQWEWLTYTMNGSMAESNIHLSDYDAPPPSELPTGLFSFLWRFINFSFRSLIPWLNVPEVDVEGLDMSDFSRELFRVQYRAPDGFTRANEPLEVRHHYVLRVEDGRLPIFWQGTQVKYLRGSVIAGVPHYSPLMAEGYLELR